MTTFVLSFSLPFRLVNLLTFPDGTTTIPAPGSSSNAPRWLGEHVSPKFLLVKLQVVRVRVCRGDNDPNVSWHLKGKPLQPSLAP